MNVLASWLALFLFAEGSMLVLVGDRICNSFRNEPGYTALIIGGLTLMVGSFAGAIVYGVVSHMR